MNGWFLGRKYQSARDRKCFAWILFETFSVALRGVVEDLSYLRDRDPGFKIRSRPLTFTKAVTEFSEPCTLWGSLCANEFC
jgi:hypothetical protein